MLIHLIIIAADSLTCSFENNLCNWRQSKNDRFDWTRISGSTPSSGTGPSQSSTGPNGMVTVSLRQTVIFVTLL